MLIKLKLKMRSIVIFTIIIMISILYIFIKILFQTNPITPVYYDNSHNNDPNNEVCIFYLFIKF